MQNYLIYAIVPIVLAVLLKLASMEKPVKIDKTSIILQYGKSLRTFGIGLPLIMIIFIILVGFENPPLNDEDVKNYLLLLSMPFPFLVSKGYSETNVKRDCRNAFDNHEIF